MVLGYNQDDSGRPPTITVFLALQPRLVPPEVSDQIFNGEQEDIVRGTNKWRTAIKQLKHCK